MSDNEISHPSVMPIRDDPAMRTTNAEAALRRIIDAAPLLLSYVDSDQRFRFANRSYAEWFGLSPEQIIGCKVVEILGAEAAKHIQAHVDAALRGESVTYETEMAYVHGGRRYVHTHLTPDIGPDSTLRGFVAAITDITERRRAEEALEHRERELAALVENSPDIICRFDRDLRCRYVSPAVTAVTGVPQEFFLGKTHDEMGLPPETCVTANEGLRLIFATGKRDSVSFTIPDSDGNLRHFDATGVPLFADNGSVESVMTVARDVTERIRIAEQNASLLRAQAEVALLQRARVRDVLFSVSEGRFRLCQYSDELPEHLPDQIGDPVTLTAPTLARLREYARTAMAKAGFEEERAQDFVTATGEAAMNAVVHAGGGTGTIRLSENGAIAQAWIEDRGRGIAEYDLHKTFRRGYSSAGTLGHGFWLMLRLADRVHMLTGASGTTVVVEMERIVPEPLWLLER